MHQSSLYQLPVQECGYEILDMTWICSAIYCQRQAVFIVDAYFNSTPAISLILI
jgi:hypothetical protein